MGFISINWNPPAKALRQFGLGILIGMGLMGGVMFWRGHHGVAYGMWALGVVNGTIGLTGSKAARPFYCASMGIGFVISNIVGRVLIAVLLYLVICPMGLVMKLMGRDRLTLRKPKGDTHWQDCPIVSDVEHYQRQS